MRSTHLLLLLSGLLVFNIYALGQGSSNKAGDGKKDEKSNTTFPEVGRPFPEFILDDVQDYKTAEVSLKDLKGKWVLLDFWGRSCGSCIRSMPKMDSIKNEFKDKVELIFIGDAKSDKRNPRINDKWMYAELKKKFGYSFAVAYDSTLYEKLELAGLPCIFVIDPAGILRGITYSITREDMAIFLKGKIPALPLYRGDREARNNYIEFNRRHPLLIENNGVQDTNFIFRSALSNWYPYMAQDYPDFSKDNNWKGFRLSDGIQILGISLSYLYNTAYVGVRILQPRDSLYGKYWPKPLLKIKDISPFIPNIITGSGYYCYSLIIKNGKADNNSLKRKMQRDLEDYFGYRVTIENNEMPCYVVTASDKMRETLKTKYPHEKVDYRKDTVRNTPINLVIALLDGVASGNQDSRYIPFIDETNISNNIDVYLPISNRMQGLEETIKVLKENGIIVTLTKREMKTVVLYDK
ncbi:TlpA disulfide reductase family protein [Chitinophaga niabensis]|uniref:TlpA family protein disulfide reductase n=1 Tax=Chitinophaga niabensis TaxID=536979 RepID=UPI0031BAFA35